MIGITASCGAFLLSERGLKMCFGGGTPAVTTVAQTPEAQDPGVVSARDSERQRRRAAASNTILTSPQGATGTAPTTGKTLLGQ